MTAPLILIGRCGDTPGQYVTSLPDGTELCRGRQAVRPAARVLLDLGYDPATMLTIQFVGAVVSSFVPRTIRAWAADPDDGPAVSRGYVSAYDAAVAAPA
tara:strand:- start:3303 stop:3602 length:300 start_codon:yes stop_codon:yes gene_type:complete